MIVPDQCYAFRNLADTASGTVQLVKRKLNGTAAATTVATATYMVPSDRIFILTALYIFMDPGAGQIAQYGNVALLLEGGVDSVPIMGTPIVENATVDLRLQNHWSGALWMAANQQIRGGGVFDAGVANNSLEVGMHGILIPRGNVQQS